jgi:hypothetical protein
MFLIVGALCEDEDIIEDLKSRAHRIVHFPNGMTEVWLDELCRVVVAPPDRGRRSFKARFMKMPITGASSPGGRSGSAGTVAASATASDEWRF